MKSLFYNIFCLSQELLYECHHLRNPQEIQMYGVHPLPATQMYGLHQLLLITSIQALLINCAIFHFRGLPSFFIYSFIFFHNNGDRDNYFFSDIVLRALKYSLITLINFMKKIHNPPEGPKNLPLPQVLTSSEAHSRAKEAGRQEHRSHKGHQGRPKERGGRKGSRAR